MQPISQPRYALLMMYDIRAGVNVPYFRFIRQELEPALRSAGLYMQDAWHIAYGPYPERQLEFITDDLSRISSIMHSPRWDRLEDKLLSYVENYTVRVTPYTGLFKV
ncbi:hypothetical protein G4Y79_02395 [Phototrophicus methaneseepsis]|uniref:NIPSNAP domain-containing protein n=1 Tax=Phototrophicus methaneseepsis TaxID=2710758 RepID=A0A7S8EAA6_9CHLR|nr:hypothetical protein [Phototrophicus methaneseepsis]QPC83246.1 hypothetical protein G4Y79_02395 [Phototrophicus methaneseepsis]